MSCHHPKKMLVRGPRVPALYGSRDTEICCKCGKYCWVNFVRRRWKPLSELPEDVREVGLF